MAGFVAVPTPNHDPDRTVDFSPGPWGDGILLRFIAPQRALVEQRVVVFGRVIPAGYETDGASVPGRAARYTDLLPAALAHDEKYDPWPGPDRVKRRDKTRLQADREFKRDVLATLAFLREDLPPIKRAIQAARDRARASYLYAAVRAGGWVAWNRGTKNGTVNV